LAPELHLVTAPAADYLSVAFKNISRLVNDEMFNASKVSTKYAQGYGVKKKTKIEIDKIPQIL
jgi:hypothetical protein